MPKRLMTEARYDASGGLNTTVSPDGMKPSEFQELTNCRVSESVPDVGAIFTPGLTAITARNGSTKFQTTGFGSAVTGLIQWIAPGGVKEVVAIAGGKLYHKSSLTDADDFTQETPATAFSTSSPQTFALFRNATSGAPLTMYIAGNRLYSWDGITVSVLAPSGLPTDIDLITSHATRLFAHSLSFPKSLYWSKVGDATNFLASGVPTDAGTAPVNVLSGEGINSLEILGSSLLIGATDSISRFTGSSTDNIQLATDTTGLSTEIGPYGPLAMKKFETYVAFITNRGPYVANEVGIAPIGTKVEKSFSALNLGAMSTSVIGYHRGRKEIWFAVPGVNDTGNQTVYVYSTLLQAWMGPWTFPYGITSFARFTNATGVEGLLAGCNDGFVRRLEAETGGIDDSTSFRASFTPAPFFHETGPGEVKKAKRLTLDATLEDNMYINHTYDFSTKTETVLPKGFGNSLFNSERLDQAPWNTAGMTWALDSTPGPLGDRNGNRVTTTDNTLANLRQTKILFSTQATYSIYIKAGTAGNAISTIGFFNDTAGTDLFFIAPDFTHPGQVLNTSGSAVATSTWSITPLDNSWLKVVIKLNGGFSTSDTLGVYAGTPSLNGTNTYVTMAQLVTGLEETPYVRNGLGNAGAPSSFPRVGVQEFVVDLDNQGRRGDLQFVARQASNFIVYGYKLEAYDMKRQTSG